LVWFGLVATIFTFASQCVNDETMDQCDNAEHVATCSGAKGLIWIGRLAKEIGLTQIGGDNTKFQSIPIIYSDSKSAIAIAEAVSSHGRTKHIDTQYHFIREKIASKILEIRWISTGEQIADILTKALTPCKFRKFQSQLVVPTNGSTVNTKGTNSNSNTQSIIDTGSHGGAGASEHTPEDDQMMN